MGRSECETALTTQMATDGGGVGVKLTRESEVGEKSLLWTESQCPAKRRTLRPDCGESQLQSWRGLGAPQPHLAPEASKVSGTLRVWKVGVPLSLPA